jgi:hypothetical protein
MPFTDAEQNGFGTGTFIVPGILLLVYTFVGIFAIVMDEILNLLEYYARDTSYQVSQPIKLLLFVVF